MKKIICFTVLLIAQFFYGQAKAVKKPENVIIINNEIATMEQVEKYSSEGYVKAMRKGVSEKERNELAKKFGDKIGDKEFIILISLFTEKEKVENDRKNTNVPQNEMVAENEYILNVNDKATDFTLTLVDGSEVKLSDLKGKVVLVNFWATWCGPCLMEFYDIPEKIIKPFKNDILCFWQFQKVRQKKRSQKK